MVLPQSICIFAAKKRIMENKKWITTEQMPNDLFPHGQELQIPDGKNPQKAHHIQQTSQ